MRSVFEKTPFGRYDMGRYAPPAFGRQVPLLGQDAGADIGGVFEGLVKSISDLVAGLPAEALGKYKEELKRCQDIVGDDRTDFVKLGLAAECLRKLYQEIRSAKDRQAAAPPPQAPPSEFPYIPVAIAGVGAIVLVIALTKL
jgi:hypothetical protein